MDKFNKLERLFNNTNIKNNQNYVFGKSNLHQLKNAIGGLGSKEVIFLGNGYYYFYILNITPYTKEDKQLAIIFMIFGFVFVLLAIWGKMFFMGLFSIIISGFMSYMFFIGVSDMFYNKFILTNKIHYLKYKNAIYFKVVKKI